MRPLTLLLTLLALGSTASGQGLGPVRTLPGDDGLAPAAFNQLAPAIVRGGDRYLVVWVDYRIGGNDLVLDEAGTDLYAARLDADGALLDPVPILISGEAANQGQSRVAWNGTNWLVAWISQAPAGTYYADGLRAVRVAPDGQVLDPEPIALHGYASSSGSEFALASDGDGWAVVARGTSAGDTDPVGYRIAADGTVLDPDGTVLVSGTYTLTFGLGLAFAEDTYLFTYAEGDRVLGIRLAPDLQPRDAAPIAITTASMTPESPRVASNGTDFFVVWRLFFNGTYLGEVRGARVSRAGQVLDPAGRLLYQGYFGGEALRVIWDGLSWLATFRAGEAVHDYRAVRVAADGTVLNPNGTVVVTGFLPAPEIADVPGGGARVVFEDDSAGGAMFTPYDIGTFGFTPTLTAGPRTTVSFGAPAQVQADVVRGDGGGVIVYRSETSGEARIVAHPLDAAGDPLLPEPVLLAAGPNLNSPAVAWDGTRYLVVWYDPAAVGILGRRLAPDGTLLDAAPFFVMPGFGPDVAAAGGLFLVVNVRPGLYPQWQYPYGVRVDGASASILDVMPRLLGYNHARVMSVAGMGDRWVVVYQRNFSHLDARSDVSGTFVALDGAVGPPFVMAGGVYNYDPAVASDGPTALVLWKNSHANSDDVLGARVLPDGTVSAPFTVSGANDEQDHPALAWDGTRYVALFEDQHDATFFLDGRSDVFGARLDAAGTVLDPAGFAVFDEPLSEVTPAVAGAQGVSWLVASDFEEAAPYAAYRVAYRILGAQSAVAVEAQPVGGPITIGPGGGSFQFRVTLTNTTGQPQSFQAWTAVTGPVGREPVMGPLSVTLPPGATLTRTLRQQVPVNAPAGSYTYHVRLGTLGGTVLASDSFPFTKEGVARGAGSEAGWAVSGWDEGAQASATLPEGFALSEAHPNPSTGTARLTLDLAVAQHVTAAAFDALGRRVAVLLDGAAEAGAHTLVLDGSALPAGVYVIRVTGESFTATRRITLLR